MNRKSNSVTAIGVLTSGGDSAGMNSAIRASIRMGLYLGCKMFFIKEGYLGMIEGGENIVAADWSSVSSIIHIGGTIIGSARCEEFRERSGRLKAAENLVKRGITNLVVIGGDGSLTGANLFRVEWSSLLDELLKTSRISNEERQKNKALHIAGMVGSIDNDFCGTDMTIGTDSALHRIIEAIDAIVSTAYSHQRTFIMEVMGRKCGYLALVSALSCEADYLFIPEDPVPLDWRLKLCEKLREERKAGERLSIVILAEGAIDVEGNQITSEMVRAAVVEELNHDTRVTVLGHVQRGGKPSASDQLLGCRLGAEAVLTLLDSKDDDEAYVIVQEGNRVCGIPLMDAVQKTQAVAKAIADKRFQDALELRGRAFSRNLKIYKLMAHSYLAPDLMYRNQNRFTFAVMHAGTPACGMNAAVHSFVRNSIFRGHKVFGIHHGFEGLVKGDFKQLNWTDVTGWVGRGGAELKISDALPEGKHEEIARRLKDFNIQGLVVIGGFEAFHAAGQLVDQRKNFSEFSIPICVIPATISNNVPGTEVALGVDTSVNAIVNACNNLRLAGAGSKRAFVVETMGGYCGYLATVSGLAAGADVAYIFEENFTIKDLQRDFDNLQEKMMDGVARGLILRNENASRNYSTDFIHRLFAEEGKETFSTRANIFGHWQLGGTPSPFDRNVAQKMSAQAVEWMDEQANKGMLTDGNICATSDESACILCLQQREYKFITLESLVAETDFE